MQTTWTVVGTVELPAGETASNLKLWAMESVNPSSLVSDIALLEPTGTPPMANFQLNIDVGNYSRYAVAYVDLYVFNDIDGNGTQGINEGSRLLAPIDVTCPIWADGVTKSSLAAFSYIFAGVLNATTDGWYYSNCFSTYDCLNRITSSNQMLTGAKLGYSSSNTTPLQP